MKKELKNCNIKMRFSKSNYMNNNKVLILLYKLLKISKMK